MKIKTVTTGALLVTLLAGCAGGQKPTIVKGTGGSSLQVDTRFASPEMNNNFYADTQLREVTPVAPGVGVGLMVLGSVLSGGISLNTANFDKNNYKGTKIDAMPEPTRRYFAPKAEAKIAQYLSKQGGSYAYGEPLYIAASRWSLVYSDLSTTNSNYDLSYRVIFYKRPEGGSMFSAFTMASCEPTVKTAPIAEWRANNYQKVTQETEKMMDACLLELDNQLPRLLKKSA